MDREYTKKLLEMCYEGELEWSSVAVAALNYLSDADVKDMAYSESFLNDKDET